MEWMDRSAALERLGVKSQSLYAYVSRGLIRARPDERDPRASQYSASDIARLMQRKRSRRSRAAVASQAIAWGDPVLETALTGVEGGRLVYAGQDAVELARTASLEDVARLLWGSAAPIATTPRPRPPEQATAKARALCWLAGEAAAQPLVSTDEAWRLLDGVVDAACGIRGRGAIHGRLAAHWRAPGAAEAIRAALVLVADHELNPSTFAARVAAGTGAGLAACALAGLSTLTGPRHGEASAGALTYLREVAAGADTGVAVSRWMQAGAPGAGHLLYAGFDPRAAALLAVSGLGSQLTGAVEAAVAASGLAPNIDMALAALTVAHGLPDDAPFVLFATGRMVGWLAHALEQHASGAAIRPRARYVGAAPA